MSNIVHVIPSRRSHHGNLGLICEASSCNAFSALRESGCLLELPLSLSLAHTLASSPASMRCFLLRDLCAIVGSLASSPSPFRFLCEESMLSLRVVQSFACVTWRPWLLWRGRDVAQNLKHVLTAHDGKMRLHSVCSPGCPCQPHVTPRKGTAWQEKYILHNWTLKNVLSGLFSSCHREYTT